MRNYWNNLTPGNRNLLKLISLVFIVLALPLTVWVVGQTQNTQQKAAPVDQLEAEGGVLGGNATVITDTSTSGGKSVLFTQSIPTQSISPTPTGLVYPPDTTLRYAALNNDSRPGYLSEITDSTWGTKVRRISNTHMWRNLYPKQQPWNKDSSRIFLGYGFRLLDGTTYADLGQVAYGVEYPIWSNVNPDWMYGASDNQNVLKRYSLATDKWTILHTFAGKVHISLGNYEGNASDDDKISLIFRTTAGVWGVLVYDPIANVEGPALTIGTEAVNEPNNVSISRSGASVMVQHGAGGSGATQGTRLYRTADMSSLRLITAARSHGDMCRDAAGNDIYVHVSDGRISSHRISDGISTFLLPSSYHLGHVSCTNYNRPGWAYLSQTPLGTFPGFDQIFAVKTDGSQTVEVFAFGHAALGDGSQYSASPFAAASRDGTKVIWGGTWGGSTTSQIYSFVAGVK